MRGKLTAMKNHDRLAKIMAEGKWRFILVRGVLRWGLLSAVLVATLTFITKKDVSTMDLAIPFVILPPFGILWGTFMWSVMKRRFESPVDAPHNEDT